MLLSQRKNSRGFLLLEVILSVLIIGSVLLLVMRSYVTSLRAGQVSRGLSKACYLLEEQIFNYDVRGFGEGLKEETETEVFKDDPTYGFTMAINTIGQTKKLNTVNMGVLWKRHTINIATYLKVKEG